MSVLVSVIMGLGGDGPTTGIDKCCHVYLFFFQSNDPPHDRLSVGSQWQSYYCMVSCSSVYGCQSAKGLSMI